MTPLLTALPATLRRYPPRLVGAVALGVVLAVLAAVVLVGRAGLGERGYTAEFAQAGELRPDDEVRVAGIEVGSVTGVELAGDRVLVAFRVDDDVPLGPATTASIKLTTVLGGRYLDLRPAGDGDLPGGLVPLAHTTVPYDLQKVLQTGTPLLEDLDPQRIRAALQAGADATRADGPRITAALDGLSRLSGVVVRRRDQITRLLDSADAAAGLVDERTGRIVELVGQSDRLLGDLVRRRDLIRSVLTDTAGVTARLRRVLADNQDVAGPLLRDADTLTGLLREQDDAVDRALELIAPSGRYLTNALGNGPYLDVYQPYGILPDNLLCQAGALDGCR